jgi:hypothetical protein
MSAAYDGSENAIMRALAAHENRCRRMRRKTADFRRGGTVIDRAALPLNAQK